MKFVHTYVRETPRLHCEAGSPIKIKYAPRFDEFGRLILEEVGRENLAEYINSFAESCDIHVIMAKFANGEPEVLSKKQGTYGDFTECPTTLAEMFNRVKRGEEMFNALPAEIKKQFGNSFPEFAVATQDYDTFLQKLNAGVVKPEQVKKEESEEAKE